MTYQVKIAQFEGPFDLILFFIERDELDIHDIPIHQLAEDFLAYIRDMKELNIELASEFILVAATLMRIKAKTLLPRKELDEHGEEIDPRAEFVNRLLEYRRYKDVLDDLKKLEIDRSSKFGRQSVKQEGKNIAEAFAEDLELDSLNLYKLLKIFHKVTDRFEDRMNEVRHTVVQHPFTLEQQRELLLDMIEGQEDLPFEKVFENCESKIEAIFRFLALLEMISYQLLEIRVGLGNNNFWLNAGKSPIAALGQDVEGDQPN